MTASKPVRFLSFIHRSPYATWNPLAAWIRHQGKLPEEVVLAHLAGVEDQAVTVEKGVHRILEHYGADGAVRHLPVADNRLDTWHVALQRFVDEEPGPWVVDVTGARTIPKLAAARVIRPPERNELLYLDVQGYRYDPKPFSWIPYNLQTIRFLRQEHETPRYARVQYLGMPPGTPPMARLGAKKVGVDRFEARVPWESLVVLLNEAGAAGKGKEAGVGVQEFTIKMPALGVTIGRYNLETRRFRLESWSSIQSALQKALRDLPSVWQDEVPREDFVLEALASARLLPFLDQARYQQHLHEVAAATRGPNPGTPLKAIALDTNLFYLEFFTSLTHAAKVPMTRVPVVASHVSLLEIRHKMNQPFPNGEMPRILSASHVHHPHEARKAHAAHEEFEMLRTRCRMTVVRDHEGQAGGPGANDANDEAILLDLHAHQQSEGQELLVLSNDRGFVERGQSLGGLQVEHVQYGDPETQTAQEADVDQIAYFVYRLALGYGLVSLKGLQVELLGDHPPETSRRFLHEDVIVQMPDKPWTRGFLHECRLREPLRQVTVEGGVWL